MTNVANKRIADIFKALANPTRLHIIQLLKQKPLCVCEIIQQIGSEQSNTSQHLSVLKNQGIVDSKKEGLMVIYNIKSSEVYQIIDIAQKLLIKKIDETRAQLSKDKK